MIKRNEFNLTIFISLAFFSFGVFLYSAPTTRVAFIKLDGQNVSNQLERAVNEVILSFTNEIKGYIIEDFSQTSEENINMTGEFTYIFTGQIVGLDQGVRLELVLKNKQKQVVRSISKDYEGSNKILLESRLLVKDLFEGEDVATINEKNDVQPEEKVESIQLDMTDFKPISSLDSLAGAWYGEDGEVEKIMIMRGGRGVAIWVSGISLLLDLKLEDGSLIVTQKGLPQPRQFIDLPDNIASLAAKATKPIVWQLHINQDLKILSGLKKTSTIKYNNNEIISVSEVSVPVKWHRN
ncbi:MAG: TP0183 family DNA metabolism protein [Treponema sp.]